MNNMGETVSYFEAVFRTRIRFIWIRIQVNFPIRIRIRFQVKIRPCFKVLKKFCGKNNFLTKIVPGRCFIKQIIFYGIIYFKKVKIIKNEHKQWIFIVKVDILDPDPYIEYGSRSETLPYRNAKVPIMERLKMIFKVFILARQGTSILHDVFVPVALLQIAMWKFAKKN